ncbi:hypothetical protein GCM10028803_07970 [Larkinella knui]|uniref:CcmD family protein n=1 Tax=Larkinella knui TaxID=2025310 RepID=UPI00163B578E|nr:hypothetical protein [Larkinella knui]
MYQLIDLLTKALREDGKIWVVTVVVAVVLLGWLYYLLRIGSRVNKLQLRIKR